MASHNLKKFSRIQSSAFLTTAERWKLIQIVRDGISYSFYHELIAKCPYNLQEWATFLSLSDRTLQRYRYKRGSFDTLRSERILRVYFLTNKGKDVFGDPKNFHAWLTSKSIAMGSIEPIELMHSSFGMDLIEDELGRIEHGILA